MRAYGKIKRSFWNVGPGLIPGRAKDDKNRTYIYWREPQKYRSKVYYQLERLEEMGYKLNGKTKEINRKMMRKILLYMIGIE